MDKIRDTIEEIRQKADVILEDKAIELKEINAKINNISQELSEMHKDLSKAINDTNEAEFKKISKKITELDNTLLMYHTKREQLQRNEFISESESDAVIDRLLSLQDENADCYSEELKPHLEAVLEISKKYWDDMIAIESLITHWSAHIHANYNTRGKVIKNGSTRMDYPVPVRTVAYMGCKEFKLIEDVLRQLTLTRAGVGMIKDNN